MVYFIKISKLFKRSPTNVWVNIIGLSLSISCAILIFIHVNEQLSYDQYHEKKERIYRLFTTDKYENGDNHRIALSNYVLGQILIEEYPEVDEIVRLLPFDDHLTISYKNRRLIGENFYYSDPSVFSVFTYPLIKGDPATALENERSVVISERLAKQYFGSQDPILETLKINGEEHLVTGVMKNIPRQSDMKIEALLSMPVDWNDFSWVYTFVLFNNSFDESEFAEKLSGTVEYDLQPYFENEGIEIDICYQKLEEIHFARGLLFDTSKANKKDIYLFSLVGILLLVMAAINHINLSIANGEARKKEVMVRKVSGATRRELFFYFFFENLLFTCFALVLALGLCAIVFPYFSQLNGSNINWKELFYQDSIYVIALIFVAINILSSLYPSFYLSSYSPVKILNRENGRKHTIRKSILVAQFVCSTGLILCTLVVHKQMNFIDQKDIGFTTKQILNLTLPREKNIQKKALQFKENLIRQSGISNVSLVGYGSVPGSELDLDIFEMEGHLSTEKRVLSYIEADRNYLELLNLKLLYGREFIPNSISDKNSAFLVNETYVKYLGLQNNEQDVIGRSLNFSGSYNNQYDGTIIGVLKDFNFKSLHHKVQPLVIIYNEEYPWHVLIKYTINNHELLISQVKELWYLFFPDSVFDFSFLNEDYQAQYKKENAMHKLFMVFTIISLTITGLGLFSLSLITIQKRTKEICLRKVLGASLHSITSILIGEYLTLLAIAFIIAVPMSWLVMDKWLSGFAYRAQLSFELFFIVGTVSILIILLPMLSHIFRIGKLNPIDALKHE